MIVAEDEARAGVVDAVGVGNCMYVGCDTGVEHVRPCKTFFMYMYDTRIGSYRVCTTCTRK